MKKSNLQKIIKFCEKEKLYFGEGTPTAKILFIGKEAGWNNDMGEAIDENIPIVSTKLVKHNLHCWKHGGNGCLKKLKEDALSKWPKSPTWRSYETLVKTITGENFGKYDFLDYSFITELSQICMPNSKHLKGNNLTEESVEKRKKLFRQAFFQNFPIVIMACGHYPRSFRFNIEKTFGVKWNKKTIKLSERNYYNVHYGKMKNGQDKILIHTRQVSNRVTNQLIFDIAELCKPIYNKYIASMKVAPIVTYPDVRDGLTLVQRRILYAMWNMKLYSRKPSIRSGIIVEDVIGKYQPHGDIVLYNDTIDYSLDGTFNDTIAVVYDAMVNMTQNWLLRYPMIDGLGNFGSANGYAPAYMDYTEARMEKISEDMLEDIEKDTVQFENNFDDSLQEPCVLPAKIPALLINGFSGIAVDMVTSMAPHNLSEVCNGIAAYIDNSEITIAELMEYINAPDFPTGCTIYGYEGVREAFETGRGKIVMRGEATIEEKNGKNTITVTSLPYLTNSYKIVEHTVALIREGKIDEISNIENDWSGTKIIYELKQEAEPNVVLNKLYQYTALQSSFSVNNVVLVNECPMLLNLKDTIVEYVKHRHEVVVRRTKYDLQKALKVKELLKVLDVEVIELILNSKTVKDACNSLIEKWQYPKIQAKKIVMCLSQLVGLEHKKPQNEYDELLKKIDYLHKILEDEDLRMQIIKNELVEMKEKYGDERRSKIEFSVASTII